MTDFNKDMDRYLKTRKEKKPKSLSIKIKKEKKFAKGVEPYDEKGSKLFKPKDESEYQELEDELEEVESEKELSEDQIEERKEGVLKRFFGFFKAGEPEDIKMDDELVEMEPVMDEEVKEALKIGLKWIEKLPKNKLTEFKSSGDAEKYKGALIKYGIAKNK